MAWWLAPSLATMLRQKVARHSRRMTASPPGRRGTPRAERTTRVQAFAWAGGRYFDVSSAWNPRPIWRAASRMVTASLFVTFTVTSMLTLAATAASKESQARNALFILPRGAMHRLQSSPAHSPVASLEEAGAAASSGVSRASAQIESAHGRASYHCGLL